MTRQQNYPSLFYKEKRENVSIALFQASEIKVKSVCSIIIRWAVVFFLYWNDALVLFLEI